MSTGEQIREYIQDEIANGRAVSAEESLLDAGILDSLAVVKLIAYLENEFDLEIPDSEFDPENFESVASIARLIDRVRS